MTTPFGWSLPQGDSEVTERDPSLLADMEPSLTVLPSQRAEIGRSEILASRSAAGSVEVIDPGPFITRDATTGLLEADISSSRGILPCDAHSGPELANRGSDVK